MLVVALDLLHNDFKITITPLFYLSNKDFEKIQLIVTSTEVTNLGKQATGIIGDLTIMAKKKKSQQ